MLALHGISRDAWKRYGDEGYRHWDIVAPGYKYNMFDIQAALVDAQLDRVDAFWERRRRWWDSTTRRWPDFAALRAAATT